MTTEENMNQKLELLLSRIEHLCAEVSRLRTEQDLPNWLTPKQARRVLGVSDNRTLKRMSLDYDITYKGEGRSRRYNRDDCMNVSKSKFSAKRNLRVK